jgi:predicted ATPase
MIAALDHSWRLLAPAERSMLRQLSVFRGGFTREAAQAVAGATVRDLASLADASWLRLGRAGHYAIHELSRQYCAERLEEEHLAEAGESADQVRQRHAAYYQSSAGRALGGLLPPPGSHRRDHPRRAQPAGGLGLGAAARRPGDGVGAVQRAGLHGRPAG